MCRATEMENILEQMVELAENLVRLVINNEALNEAIDALSPQNAKQPKRVRAFYT